MCSVFTVFEKKGQNHFVEDLNRHVCREICAALNHHHSGSYKLILYNPFFLQIAFGMDSLAPREGGQ